MGALRTSIPCFAPLFCCERNKCGGSCACRNRNGHGVVLPGEYPPLCRKPCADTHTPAGLCRDCDSRSPYGVTVLRLSHLARSMQVTPCPQGCFRIRGVFWSSRLFLCRASGVRGPAHLWPVPAAVPAVRPLAVSQVVKRICLRMCGKKLRITPATVKRRIIISPVCMSQWPRPVIFSAITAIANMIARTKAAPVW